MKDIEDPKIQAMFREVGICAHLIGVGMTTIRKADFVNAWRYGGSFFELTIGIERLCKIILIRKYQRENSDAFPNNNYIRSFSHVIKNLVLEVTKNYDNQYIGKNEIADQIIIFLSEFAKTNRYYNLDTITKNLPKENDPLYIWNEISEHIIQKHYKEKKFSPIESALIDTLQENAMYIHHDLHGNLIDNARDFYTLGKTVTTVQKYTIFYLYMIIKDLLNVVHNEEDLYYTMPVISEFFPYFYEGSLTKTQILNKKGWVYL
jgi:6-pyruvoyl-tetrahydropterin synthase